MTNVHCHCIVDRLGKVWTSQNRWEVLFFLYRESHALQIWPTPKTCMQFSNRTLLETLRPSEVVETALRHTSLVKGVNWCEVQLFFGAPPSPKHRWKALD